MGPLREQLLRNGTSRYTSTISSLHYVATFLNFPFHCAMEAAKRPRMAEITKYKSRKLLRLFVSLPRRVLLGLFGKSQGVMG